MAHPLPSGQSDHRSGGGLFAFLGERNLLPTAPSATRSMPARRRQRVQDILPTTMRTYVLHNDRLASSTKRRLPHFAIRSQQQAENDAMTEPSYLLALPQELLGMVMTLIIDDPKTLASVRASSKLLKEITQHDFCRLHIADIQNLSTTKALERLVWTSREPSLAPSITSITVDFHNTRLRLSYVLRSLASPGIVDFHIKDDAPLSIALVNLKHFGNAISLRIRVSKKPSDLHSTVNIVMYVVLCHIILRSEPDINFPCRKVVVEFDSPPLPERTVKRIFHDDMEERYKLIWGQMLRLKAVDEISVKFAQREGVEQSPLPHTMTIKRSENGLHVRFHNIHEDHFGAMGIMNIFSRLCSLEMQDCSIADNDLEALIISPNLKYLRLHNIGLGPYGCAYLSAIPRLWLEMLQYIAETTNLQSCRLSGLTDWDGTKFQSELWEAESENGKTVSEALLHLVEIRSWY